MVKLVPISEDYFQVCLHKWIVEYADEKVTAGAWKKDESLELSRDEFERLLPKGRDTPDQYVLSIVDESEKILGAIWFGVYRDTEPHGAFIWNFRLEENERGKGYSKLALSSLYKMLHDMDIEKLTLHVFSQNEIAVNLYKKMGFVVTDLMMAKEIR